MSATTLRIIGLTATLVYAAAILRVYVQRPASLPEISGSLTSVVRAYQVDRERFDQGLRFFRNNQFPEARDAFAQADPGRQDATVQFYVAYSCLREGWGRAYSDDTLFKAGKGRARSRAAGGAGRHDHGERSWTSSCTPPRNFRRNSIVA